MDTRESDGDGLSPREPSATPVTTLRGERLHLRTIRERDLDDLHVKLSTLEYRGSYFPLGLQAEPTLRGRF